MNLFPGQGHLRVNARELRVSAFSVFCQRPEISWLKWDEKYRKVNLCKENHRLYVYGNNA